MPSVLSAFGRKGIDPSLEKASIMKKIIQSGPHDWHGAASEDAGQARSLRPIRIGCSTQAGSEAMAHPWKRKNFTPHRKQTTRVHTPLVSRATQSTTRD